MADSTRARPPVKNYCDLVVWQRAMELVVLLYRCSSTWPGDERFGLTQQVRRAALSVPSNIAEGHGRRSDADFGRFLAFAHGSLLELETQVEVARRLAFMTDADAETVAETSAEVGRLIQGLRRSLRENKI